MNTAVEEDFVEILKEKLSDRCRLNNRYSLRAFARDLGISPQRLSHILNGRHGLSIEAAKKIANALNMNSEEQDQFCTLVQRKHSRSGTVRIAAENKLNELRTTYKTLEIDNFRIISDWYHFAIMELTLLEDFQSSFKWISNKLGINEIEAKIAVERLLKLELLETDKKKGLKLTGQFYADPKGTPSSALRNFHRQLILKATEALEVQSLKERDVGALIVAIDTADIPEAQEEIRKFREKFDRKFSQSKRKTHVYCLSTQFFNLTRS